MKKLLLCLTALSCVIISQAENVTLEFNLSKGATYTQTTQSNVNMAMGMPEQSINIDISIITGVSFTVTAIKETVYDINVVYDSMAIKVSMPNMTQEFHTGAVDPNDMLSNMMNQLKGKSFQLMLSKKGNILAVNHLDSIFSALTVVTDQLPAEQQAQFKIQLEQNFGKEAFCSNLENAFAIFPDKTVAVGDTWIRMNKTKSNNMPVDIATTYTLKEITDDWYVISGVSVISADSTSSFSGMMPSASMKMDITGNMTSDIKLNRTTNWPISNSSKTFLDAALKMEGEGGMDMKMKVSGETIMKGE